MTEMPGEFKLHKNAYILIFLQVCRDKACLVSTHPTLFILLRFILRFLQHLTGFVSL